MTTLLIHVNPPPAPGASRKQARANVDTFCEDVGASLRVRRYKGPHANEDGCWSYTLRCRESGETFRLDMRGEPVEEIRWTQAVSIVGFPRIYVDGNSWAWQFGVEFVQFCLRGRGVKLASTRLRGGPIRAAEKANRKRS